MEQFYCEIGSLNLSIDMFLEENALGMESWQDCKTKRLSQQELADVYFAISNSSFFKGYISSATGFEVKTAFKSFLPTMEIEISIYFNYLISGRLERSHQIAKFIHHLFSFFAVLALLMVDSLLTY
jgi:hypothetical protein